MILPPQFLSWPRKFLKAWYTCFTCLKHFDMLSGMLEKGRGVFLWLILFYLSANFLVILLQWGGCCPQTTKKDSVHLVQG